MTANPSNAELESRDAAARDAVPNPEAPDVTGYLPELDSRTMAELDGQTAAELDGRPATEDDDRSAAEIAQDRDEASVGTPVFTEEQQRPTIPAIPQWVVPVVSAVLVFGLLAFPLGWTIWAALIGAIAAAGVSYAFVAKL